jgi:hypothetical protein
VVVNLLHGGFLLGISLDPEDGGDNPSKCRLTFKGLCISQEREPSQPPLCVGTSNPPRYYSVIFLRKKNKSRSIFEVLFLGCENYVLQAEKKNHYKHKGL